jgi:hypothetical protein
MLYLFIYLCYYLYLSIGLANVISMWVEIMDQDCNNNNYNNNTSKFMHITLLETDMNLSIGGVSNEARIRHGIYLYISIYIYMYLSYISIYLCIYQSIYLYIYHSIYIYIYVFILYIYLSIYVFIYICIYL